MEGINPHRALLTVPSDSRKTDLVKQVGCLTRRLLRGVVTAASRKLQLSPPAEKVLGTSGLKVLNLSHVEPLNCETKALFTISTENCFENRSQSAIF